MRFINGFNKGWINAKVFFAITKKFEGFSPELNSALASNGLTKQDWSAFAIGSDKSFYGFGYSFAGFLFFLTHGAIARN